MSLATPSRWRDHDLSAPIAAGVAFLEGHQLETGELPSYWRFPSGGQVEWAQESSPFATSLAVMALAGVPGSDGVRSRATSFLQSEMEPPCLWRHYGIRTEQHDYAPSDLDDTACASMALNLAGVDTGSNRAVVLANRSTTGTFYTWIVPRAAVPASLAWWRAGWSELVARRRRRAFWRDTSADPYDVDGVVNANVVTYLGPEESTWAASAYLVDIVVRADEDGCDKWYPDAARFHYAISRAIRGGNRVLGAVTGTIAERVAGRLEADIGNLPALSIALAAAALGNLGRRGPAYEAAVAAVLAAQQADGSWARDPIYVGGPQPSPVWASEAVTTATCLEVLAGCPSNAGPLAGAQT